MNRLLVRQLKRHFGWGDEATSEAALLAIEQGDFSSLPAQKMRSFLQAIDESYDQAERDLELRSRSLELSSAELTQANQDLRLEAVARQRVLDSLWDTANVLLKDLGHQEIRQDQTSLEQLSNLLRGLVDEKKQVEAQLVAAKEAADQANRLKSDFLANMSHEIRTPMNAILGMTHLMLKTDLSAKQRDYLQKSSSAAESLLHILNDILDFSKIEANRLQIELVPFRLASLTDQLCALHQVRAEEKGLKLAVAVSSDCPAALVGDPLRIGQILNNLVSNAIKFTSHGTVRVQIERVAQIGSQVRLHFTVQDSGIGLKPEQISRLFKPFIQADGSTTRKFGGTGLGLSICKRLVNLMEGDIWVESTPEVGSTFHFTLALEKSDALAAEMQTQTQIGPQFLHGLRILLVEDNPLNQQVASELLSGVGASVILAQHGGEALGWLSIDPLPCDLILMDLQMPVLDGNEATRLIRCDARLQQIPIIAMTAHAMSDERQRCLDNGMNDYVTKPIQPDVLFSCIAKWAGDKITQPESFNTLSAYTDESIVPIIEGVDTQDVLARLMGDPQLYEALFRQFANDYQNAYAQYQQLLTSDQRAAERLVHSIKGVAGTLGMTQLCVVATQLEQQLRQHPGQPSELNPVFGQEIDTMLAAISRVYLPENQSKPDFAIDTQVMKEIFLRLEGLLQNCDGDAIDEIEHLKTCLAAWPDQTLIDRLAHTVSQEFNFDRALFYCRELKAAILERIDG